MWHQEVITDAVERTLQDLRRISVLAKFYLAGGTGLALHIGHRRSVDLDFFSSEPFDPETVLARVQQLDRLHVLARDFETLHLTVAETKVSFLGHRYPMLFSCDAFFEVSLADLRDIGCMKISAVAGRGTRRDFIDLYAVSKRYGLEQLLAWFKEKYARANYSLVHVLKSLTYFEDAEKDPMPDMIASLSWETVKQYFSAEVPRLL